MTDRRALLEKLAELSALERKYESVKDAVNEVIDDLRTAGVSRQVIARCYVRAIGCKASPKFVKDVAEKLRKRHARWRTSCPPNLVSEPRNGSRESSCLNVKEGSPMAKAKPVILRRTTEEILVDSEATARKLIDSDRDDEQDEEPDEDEDEDDDEDEVAPSKRLKLGALPKKKVR